MDDGEAGVRSGTAIALRWFLPALQPVLPARLSAWLSALVVCLVLFAWLRR